MSDIELVIKVPEDTYKDIIKNGFIYDEDNEVVTHAIMNGTPLPKGHGKLKDADKIVAEIDSAYPNLDRQDIKQWVFNAETIIEADKS